MVIPWVLKLESDIPSQGFPTVEISRSRMVWAKALLKALSVLDVYILFPQ